MKKDIVIITQYLRLQRENGNSRFTYLSNLLSDYNVEIITSNFQHAEKKHRNEKFITENNYTVTFLDEPGYRKNVTLKRFYSHYILSRNLKKYLKTRKKPDLLYCSVPSFDVGLVASNYCKKNNIPFIIDIQDLWPEAFKMAFNIPLLSDLVFLPFKIMANKVSETYKDRGLSVNKKNAKGLSVFLGTELDTFDKYKIDFQYQNKPENEIWIAYIGTLGTSYNINVITDALARLKEKGIDNIKFVVMGNGPLKGIFEEYAQKKGVYNEFTGRLAYNEMVSRLCQCDIAVNPIVAASVSSIINKVADYAAAGLPVINTQRSEEYQSLLNEYHAGVNCNNDDVEGIVEAIVHLYTNDVLRKEMGTNNRKLAEEKFDRKNAYPQIVELIKNFLN